MKFTTIKSKKEVIEKYPSAQEIVKVCGGYMVFFTMQEYQTWKAQK